MGYDSNVREGYEEMRDVYGLRAFNSGGERS